MVAIDEVRTAGAPATLAISPDRSAIRADGEDLAFVTVDIVDSQGVNVPTASNLVSFSIAGPGAMVGVDNGNASSTEAYKGTMRQAFNGKCLAIVRSTGLPGRIQLIASAIGLAPGSVMITAQS